jgi:pimeloyl-ACP methyl ester carboxylesterase
MADVSLGNVSTGDRSAHPRGGGAMSSRRPGPFKDDGKDRPVNGISEKIHVRINGLEQGMFIESRDEAHPVLLFLHGGPGMPEHFLTRKYPTGLEDHFTVAWWEQRGSGLSYRSDIPPETMTVEQMISDTLEVTNYLRRRFSVEKIYLMGHSGGSFYGIQAAARSPERYHAYIGVSQISYQLRSEVLAYEYMLDQFKRNGNARMARRLEQGAPTLTTPLPASYLALRDKAMHSLGIGTTRDMRSVITGVFIPSWLSRDYTLREKMNLWRGKFFSMRLLRDEIFATDLSERVRELELPVYLCHGVHDQTVSYPETRSYFGRLKAPLKGFYTFERSAHSPMFEEPERMLRIMLDDVLAGGNGLSDPLQ